MRLTELVVKLKGIRRLSHYSASDETGSWYETDSEGQYIDYSDYEKLINELEQEIARERV